jgi:hypothetical protein
MDSKDSTRLSQIAGRTRYEGQPERTDEFLVRIFRELCEKQRRLTRLAMNACDDYDGMGRDPVVGLHHSRQAFEHVANYLRLLDRTCSSDVQIDPRVPFSYSPEAAARVRRELPLWAQQLISDLVRPR